MTAFAFGPELSPLVVVIVDSPVGYFTQDLEPKIIALGIPILACSILYPLAVYLVGMLIIRLRKRARSADMLA